MSDLQNKEWGLKISPTLTHPISKEYPVLL